VGLLIQSATSSFVWTNCASALSPHSSRNNFNASCSLTAVTSNSLSPSKQAVHGSTRQNHTSNVFLPSRTGTTSVFS
jgi:hypothetical protein